MAKAWNEETEKNIQGVVNEKSKWQAAYDAGDEEGMKAAQEAAKGYYNNLTASGNYDVTKELQQSDYDTAMGYLDNYKGKKPEADGRNMVKESFSMAQDADAGKLAHAEKFGEMWEQGYKDQQKLVHDDPMNSDYAKSIMSVYTGLGKDARGEVLADGSVRNDGNLDSFTKANADRQRQAYTEAGIESVYDIYGAKLDAGQKSYDSMMEGGTAVGNEYDEASDNANSTAERISAVDETERNGDVDRNVKIADVTGYVPEEMREKNPYFNEDGTLKEVYLSEEFDSQGGFETMIEAARARGDMEEVRLLSEAKLWKVQNVPGYEKFASTAVAPAAQQTEAGRQFDENVRLSEEGNEIVKHEIDTKAALEREGNDLEKYEIDKNAELAEKEIEQKAAQEENKQKEQAETKSEEQKQTSEDKPTGVYADKVGKRVSNTATYNNDSAKGQCVWYVRGRVQEKLGITMAKHGHANQMWYNAKSSAKVKASVDNIRPNMIVSYKYGTSSAGQTYGHVIYIEDVVGDTVYYTEGGSGYYKSGTDGVVKTATRQGIMEGVNKNGKRMGSSVIGFIDVTKY